MGGVKCCLWCAAAFKQARPPKAEQVYCSYNCHLLARGIVTRPADKSKTVTQQTFDLGEIA